MKKHERVKFKLIQMPCCKHMLCWVNPRLPNFCPECGTVTHHTAGKLKLNILLTDEDAVLTVEQGFVPEKIGSTP